MRQYNMGGLKEVNEINDDMERPAFKMSNNMSSLIRLFIVIMVFVVIVLTIAK